MQREIRYIRTTSSITLALSALLMCFVLVAALVANYYAHLALVKYNAAMSSAGLLVEEIGAEMMQKVDVVARTVQEMKNELDNALLRLP